MYLKKIAIKNIGPIEELAMSFPFNDAGNPIPVIFVGKNGSGKTILQSQIMDGFYEIGSSLFDDVTIQDGLNRNFYKISGNTNLRIGQDKGFTIMVFTDEEGQTLEYFDKVGEVSKEDFTSYIKDFTLSPNSSEKQQKEITNIEDTKREKLINEWIRDIQFYQPAYRYEEPFWKNEAFINQTRFADKKRFSGNLDKELEIISSTKENKSFLLDLVLDRYVQNRNPINKTLWRNINEILQKILKNEKYRFGIGPRGGYRVSIMEQIDSEKSRQILPSIDNLSLGESVLLNFFINIIRHSGDTSKSLSEIKGIVAIDEIDVHLHTDLQYSVVPELIKLFPKIQFIITSHSPLFLLGMKTSFGDNGFEIRNLPEGKLITTERFSEFENAYNILRETEKFENEVKKKVILNTKPTVYVEGPTDVQYIKKAYELYNKSYENFNINIIGEKTNFGTKNSNNNTLANAGKVLSTMTNALKQKVILLNDPEEKIVEKEYDELLYIRKMPYFEQNPLRKGIENLFEKTLINEAKEKNKQCFEYHVVGEETKNLRIVDGQKQKICNWICKKGTKDDFKNFEKIFEIIEQIIEPQKT